MNKLLEQAEAPGTKSAFRTSTEQFAQLVFDAI